MKKISGTLSKQLNDILKKDNSNTSFSEEELSSIKSLEIAKRDLPYLDYLDNLEELSIESFPSISNDDIIYIGEKLKRIKSLKIKEQNALFEIDLTNYKELKELCLIHNENLKNVVLINDLKRFTFYDNKDFDNVDFLFNYYINHAETCMILDINYYIDMLSFMYEKNVSTTKIKNITWVESIGLRKYSVYEYNQNEIDSLLECVSYVSSRYIYADDSDIEKFAVLYNWMVNNMRFVNEDDSEDENLSLISNVNRVFSYGKGGRLTLAKAFQMLLNIAGIKSSIVYSMGATDVIGYYNGEKVFSLIGDSDYAVLRVILEGKNYYCDIAWDTLTNFHGFFDKMRFFLFSKNELKIRHKFVGEGNIDSSYSYHGDDSDELINFAKNRIVEVDELFDDIERLKPNITGKELNMAVLKLKINDLKNEIDELDMNSQEYKNKIIELSETEEKIDNISSEIVRLENEKEGIINSYSNLLIKRYLSNDTNIEVRELRRILDHKECILSLSSYISLLLKQSLKNKAT